MLAPAPRAAAFVIALKIVADTAQVIRLQALKLVQHALSNCGGSFVIHSRVALIFRPEHNELSGRSACGCGCGSFAVNASSNLDDAVQRTKGAERDRNAEIDARLDELGGNNAARQASPKPVPNFIKHAQAVLSAHACAQVEKPCLFL